MIYYVNGHFVSEEKATIPVTDLGLLRGFAVCDVMRTYKGTPLHLDEHISRLHDSADKIGIPIPWTLKETKRLVLKTISKNEPMKEINIRTIITAGSSPDFFNPTDTPRMIIMVSHLPTLPVRWYQKGIKVITHQLERNLPEAKVTSYVPAAIALKRATKKNAVEALFINRNREILECTTSNIFAFINGRLITPGQGILKGITRQAVIKLAEKQFSVEEKTINLNELLSAQEIFITGTNKGIVPVVQVDETKIGNQVPGKFTQQIIKMFEEHYQ